MHKISFCFKSGIRRKIVKAMIDLLVHEYKVVVIFICCLSVQLIRGGETNSQTIVAMGQWSQTKIKLPYYLSLWHLQSIICIFWLDSKIIHFQFFLIVLFSRKCGEKGPFSCKVQWKLKTNFFHMFTNFYIVTTCEFIFGLLI